MRPYSYVQAYQMARPAPRGQRPRKRTAAGIGRRFCLASRRAREYYPRQKVRHRRKPMQVSEILKVKGNALFTVAPEGKLAEAVSVMAQHNMGSLVVID